MESTYVGILNQCIKMLNDFVWGWPLIIAFVLIGFTLTIALRFIQVRYFVQSWALALNPAGGDKEASADMTPLQAFLNALSTSVGNGSLAGMATAIFEGGPGAAFWIFVIGFFSLPIRFAEVFLSGAFEASGSSVISGGPMLYLKQVPGRTILPAFYAVFLLLLGLTSGNAIQANSISCGVQTILPVSPYIIAAVMGLFVAYVMFGGAQRIIMISQSIVPIKVGLFFASAILLFVFNLSALWPALKIIFISAFQPQAIKGALLGTTLQSAIRFGMSRSLNATEVGLGTAAVFFGSTGGKNPVENGIMSMATAFISNYLVGFLLCLLLVMTGVWSSGLNGIELTTAAYGTLYGSVAGWLVTILSITFGIGVLVAYAYVGRECWIYLTGGRYMGLYAILYCVLAVLGSLARVDIVWSAVDIVNAGLIVLNLYAICMLMGTIRRAFIAYDQKA